MRTMRKTRKGIMSILAVAAVIAMLISTATPAEASYHVTLGKYVDEIVPGKEYVIESVKWPGKVATPDKRSQYKDYITLEKFNSASPWGSQQVWHFTQWDTKWVDDPMLGHYDVSFSRPGMWMVGNHTSYRGESGTLRLITYDKKKGYMAKIEEYNKDGSIKDTQWLKWIKLRKQDGKQVWKAVGVSSNVRMAPGGWSEVYLREPVEWD